MSNYITILLASFAYIDHYDETIDRIYHCFQIENDKIFVYNDLHTPRKKIITYNVFTPKNVKIDINRIHHTIRINRKKESNTLYTINSINSIIEKEIGKVDTRHIIDWNKYANMLLLYDKQKGLTITPISFKEILTRDMFYNNEKGEQKNESDNCYNRAEYNQSRPFVGFNSRDGKFR